MADYGKDTPPKSYATDMNSCKLLVSYVGTVTCLPTGHLNPNAIESLLLTTCIAEAENGLKQS